MKKIILALLLYCFGVTEVLPAQTLSTKPSFHISISSQINEGTDPLRKLIDKYNNAEICNIELSGRISTLEGQVTCLKGEIEELKEELRLLEKENRKLKAELKRLKAKINQDKITIAELQEQISLGEQKEDSIAVKHSLKLESANIKISELEGENSKLKDLNRDLLEAADSLSDSLRSAENKIDELKLQFVAAGEENKAKIKEAINQERAITDLIIRSVNLTSFFYLKRFKSKYRKYDLLDGGKHYIYDFKHKILYLHQSLHVKTETPSGVIVLKLRVIEEGGGRVQEVDLQLSYSQSPSLKGSGYHFYEATIPIFVNKKDRPSLELDPNGRYIFEIVKPIENDNEKVSVCRIAFGAIQGHK